MRKEREPIFCHGRKTKGQKPMQQQQGVFLTYSWEPKIHVLFFLYYILFLNFSYFYPCLPYEGMKSRINSGLKTIFKHLLNTNIEQRTELNTLDIKKNIPSLKFTASFQNKRGKELQYRARATNQLFYSHYPKIFSSYLYCTTYYTLLCGIML